MQLRTLDAVVIIAYLIFMLLVGVWGRKKAKTKDSFLVANRNLGFLILFPCLAAMTIGGGSTLGATGLGYTVGISGMWFLIALGLGVGALGMLVAPKISRLNIYTIAEMLSLRFGKGSATFSAAVIGFYLVLLSVVQIVSIGSILSVLFGWDPKIAMLIGGGIGILYSWLGGMVAITFTDVVQWIFMTVGVIFILLPVSVSNAGGLANITATLPATYMDWSTIGGSSILAYFLLYTLGTPVDQSGWHRLFTSKSTKAGVTAMVAAGAFTIIWGIAVILIGMSAAVIMPGVENSDSIFTLMTVEMLPAGVAGIVLAGAISAILSTMSGPFLAASTTMVNDFIIPLRKKESTDHQIFKWTRLCLILSGIAGLIIAFWLQGVLVALDLAYCILAGALAVPVLGGLLWKRATAKGALGALAGGLVGVVAGWIIWGVTSLYPILSGIGVSLIAFIIFSLASKPSDGYEKLQSKRLAENVAVESE